MDYLDYMDTDLEYRLELAEYNGMFDNDQKMVEEMERRERNERNRISRHRKCK